jgi:hypothetical protein
MRPPAPRPTLTNLGKLRPPMRMRASTMQMPSMANTRLRQPLLQPRRSLPRALPAPMPPSVGVGGRLSAAARRALPDSAFAGPKRTFPIPDRGHAIAAKALIGNAPPSARPKIQARANAKLGKSQSQKR